MNEDISSSQMRDHEVLDEIKSVLKLIANWMVIPLYLVFWIVDIIYIPEFKWLFLILRLTIIPLCYVVKKLAFNAVSSNRIQKIASIYAILVALPINIMISIIPDPATSYYSGLTLVAFAGLSFIPLSNRYFMLSTLGIYGPYYAITLNSCKSNADFLGVAINSFFILGAVVICFLIRFFNEKLRMREINSRLALKAEIANRDYIIEEAKNNTFIDISKQVAHDIRSPLSALNLALNSLNHDNSNELKGVAQSSIGRINQIANELLLKARIKSYVDNDKIGTNENEKQLFSISIDSIINEVINEKRILINNKKTISIETDFEKVNVFLSYNATEMYRILSNLLNNAIEAVNDIEGKIVISLRKYDSFLTISISDNGKGIPTEVLEKLGKSEISFGKTSSVDSGNGIGIYHAKMKINSWGGDLNFISKINSGTIVQIKIPLT